MRQYNPYFTPTDQADVREYLNREFFNVKNSVDQVHDLDVLATPPVPPREGMIRYADGTTWDPADLELERGAGKGPYYYDGTRWVPMFPIVAGLWYGTSSTPMNLSAAWQTYLTVVTRPLTEAICQVNGSFLAGATLTLKQLDVTMRALINGAELLLQPRWGFKHVYGTNTSLDIVKSIDVNFPFDVTSHVPGGSIFDDVTVELQAKTDSIGDIDSGYLSINEVI